MIGHLAQVRGGWEGYVIGHLAQVRGGWEGYVIGHLAQLRGLLLENGMRRICDWSSCTGEGFVVRKWDDMDL